MKRLTVLLCLCCLLLVGCDSTSETERAYNEGFIAGEESGYEQGWSDAQEEYAPDGVGYDAGYYDGYEYGREEGYMEALFDFEVNYAEEDLPRAYQNRWVRPGE